MLPGEMRDMAHRLTFQKDSQKRSMLCSDFLGIGVFAAKSFNKDLRATGCGDTAFAMSGPIFHLEIAAAGLLSKPRPPILPLQRQMSVRVLPQAFCVVWTVI